MRPPTPHWLQAKIDRETAQRARLAALGVKPLTAAEQRADIARRIAELARKRSLSDSDNPAPF